MTELLRLAQQTGAAVFSAVPGEPFENCPFGQDHAKHCVDVFNTGFLVAAHGVAVIDAGPAVPRSIIF